MRSLSVVDGPQSAVENNSICEDGGTQDSYGEPSFPKDTKMLYADKP